MNRRLVLLALGGASAALVTAPARRLLACACCADDGTRIEAEHELAGWTLGELTRIQLGPTARLRTTDAGMADDARGIRDPADTYDVALTRATDKRGHRWTLTFRDAKGNTGALSWPLPRTIDELSVDLRDGKSASAGGPLLYKEVRLRMPASGSGIFQPGNAAGTMARLVLQGRGNKCLTAEHLTHWSLDVSGPRAGYLFFGTLIAPAKR